mmetsp:Transcript_34490/g.73485  ORF Transcript_34490/g.73485 Transcript_34490/m.73485 type:complete len:300 (-) Transcript_34490:107-1006(-)|eukprot:CAMPEP_0206519434 /NCGR_PEP_ID=MMETSP0324_2-20121206/65192_1 /ASSEMBLY_ACC=CAM_ASM_000836 /TAXON_ID=2866 /ORGANISM="Crypthecodinium cohnii, Strain Seligo" /LENGTH=299 /DNA_ID=CAMNT_0054013021 /DNA_START=170 /DNA_END=1069 /DNA_ORIENTATION=+
MIAAARGYLIRGLRFPINSTASVCGHLHGRCTGAEFTWTELGEGLKGVLVKAPSADPSRIIVYFHGGGHWLLSTGAFREMGARLSAITKATVLLVNYTKPPKAVFPQGLNEAYTAYQWAKKQVGGPQRVAVAGDSSGGNLAFALLVKLAQLDEEQPCAAVGISPWLKLDLHTSPGNLYGIWCADLYLGRGKKTTTVADPLVSIVNISPELLEKLPPLLLHGGLKELVTNDIKEMAALCERHQHPLEVKLYPCPHDFQLGPCFKDASQDSFGLISEFLDRNWGPQEPMGLEGSRSTEVQL